MVMFVTELMLTPALRASCARARFSSNRVMANQRSLGISFALFIAIRQLVLQGFPTTRIRTSALAFLSIACEGKLPLGSEHYFMIEQKGPGAVVGGSTYVVRIARDPRREN